MKKILLLAFVTFYIVIVCYGAWAEEGDSDEFMLEEVLVTSEKREVVIQKIPSSVVVLEGESIVQQGKISTQQILENVPNVVYNDVETLHSSAATPDAGIAIRGVRYKQTSDGQPASATATYVDDVFQGIGGNYDLNRVEVLRGPQGTLYGRSATGGVVAFHTNNPKLSEFSGAATVEVGEANLKNMQAALNAPYGDNFAVRLAWHHFERDGYHNPDGAYSRTSEGRIKALWKPTDALDILLTGALTDRQTNSGGYGARLDRNDPDKIIYQDTVTEVAESGIRRSTMGAFTVNYDFGDSILTYIASLRHYEDKDSPYSIDISPGARIGHFYRINYGENFHTQELRLVSDTEGWFKWLVGANYYNSDYDRYTSAVQHLAYIPQLDGIPDPDEATNDAPIFEMPMSGEITNLGLFTEETFELSDAFRITAGLRYDKTKVDAYSALNMNTKINEWFNTLNPPAWQSFGMEDSIDFDNITYKLRVEYDLASDKMLYVLTATGFQPGDLRLSNQLDSDTGGFVFFSLPYDEEKLTSYEVGSKNRFLDKRLQINLSAFYYDYDGFQYTVNTAVVGPPEYAVVPVPLEIKGTELSVDWLVSENDIVTFSTGLLDAKITGFPDIPALNPTDRFFVLKRIPNVPEMTANLGYTHTFYLPNGSTLAPRTEVRCTKGMYIENLTADQVALGDKPYAWQDTYYLTDIGVSWTSSSGMYSATAYVRNVFDTEYKASITINGGPDSIGVTAGDPRAWGFLLSASF